MQSPRLGLTSVEGLLLESLNRACGTLGSAQCAHRAVIAKGRPVCLAGECLVGPCWELLLGPSGGSSMSPWLSKGPRLSRAPPSPNSLERSSCSLWAWAPCFPGSWSPPPSRTRWERVPWTPGVGVGPRFLVVHSRAPGRLWSLDLSLGRERRLRSCGERESAQGIWHQSLKLPPWGSGLGAGPPSL